MKMGIAKSLLSIAPGYRNLTNFGKLNCPLFGPPVQRPFSWTVFCAGLRIRNAVFLLV